MKGWFRPLQHRWARLLMAGAVVVPALGTTHVLPVGAVGCNPPVPCVANSVTYQGNVDEFMIFQGAVQTLASAVTASESPIGAVGSIAPPTVNPAQQGDGCWFYNCGSATYSYYFDQENWNNQPGTGSYNGGWFKPKSPPNDGNFYRESGFFNSVSRNTNDICGVGAAIHVNADQGQWSTSNYTPSSTTYNNSGNSTSTSASIGAQGFTIGGTETVSQSYATTGAYDSNKHEFYVISWEQDNNCHPWSISVLGLAPWEFSNLGSGYIHFSYSWDYAYED